MPLPECLKKLYKPYDDWEDFGKNYVRLGFADGSSGLYIPSTTRAVEIAAGLKNCPDEFWYHHLGRPVYSPCGTGLSAEFRKIGELVFVEVCGTGKNTHCLLVLKDGKVLYKEILKGGGFGLRERSKYELLAKVTKAI